MQKLKRFYKIYIYFVAIILVVGFGFMDDKGRVIFIGLYLISLPIFIYGTFVYYPRKILKKIIKIKNIKNDTSNTFVLLYVLSIAFVLLYIYIIAK
ncbi:hypothetical protein DCO58_08155 [Helicobacter saguini]|uniref:Uncharacterized protein n=1 Tax=Helicobacter saguini TaxID=1548018 RepID=A0A347VNM9_9HELI|nr:hypothetical protein [Helicobacter saguini]MWV61703.1 hypothetical protein [Helicobacter saguini]MWV67625.1 hypothetical protein [Helicobacter saguini]MWV69976.1 hypothetical protein [Helicobacter saguini]MWV72810.1 hypothetical protein [Helicobacter saguini]TLD91998.1 hypothetical protein LS64_011105 [Helicobacter saguini]